MFTTDYQDLIIYFNEEEEGVFQFLEAGKLSKYLIGNPSILYSDSAYIAAMSKINRNGGINMKITTSTLLFILCLQLTVHAQVHVGDKMYSKNPGKISKDEYERIKSQTTYFILPDKDMEQKDLYDKAIAKVWTVTPYEIVSVDEARTKNKRKSNFFEFNGSVTTVKSGMSSTNYIHIKYALVNYHKNKKDKYESTAYASLHLHLDREEMAEAILSSYSVGSIPNKKAKAAHNKRMKQMFYRTGTFESFEPSLILGYLKIINNQIEDEETLRPYDKFKEKELIQNLKLDTLYIPNYVKIKFNMFSGKESEVENDEKYLEDENYTFPIKFVSNDELNDLVLNRSGGVKYLLYVRSTTDKFVSVFDSNTGKMLYSEYTPISYNFKSKDIEKISKKIN